MSSRVIQGRYRLDEIVDQGATATVWRAQDTHLGRQVAIKLLDQPGVGADPHADRRFRAEARTLARLSHPNIVTVFDSGAEDGTAFLVMELIEGRTLRAWLKDEGPLPVSQAAAIMVQVCDALSAAHASGVVHRDIKPGNIVVTPDGTVKLCDFGIARMQDTTALTAPQIALGTSSYMAPEQITGTGHLDGRADLYAVGCVLFEMLTGDVPFAGDDPFGVAYQHLHDTAPALSSRVADVPKSLDELVKRLLAKDPSGRPADPAQVCAALRPLVDPDTDPDTLALAHPGPPVRRISPRYAKAGLAAATVVAIPVLWLLAWNEPDRGDPSGSVIPVSPWPLDATPGASPIDPTPATVEPTATPERTRPATPPGPSAPAAAPSFPEQVAAVRSYVQQLGASGELPAKNAQEFDRQLGEVANHVGQGKTREALDKIAAIRKRNDALLRDRKIAQATHDTLDAMLVRLRSAVPGAQ